VNKEFDSKWCSDWVTSWKTWESWFDFGRRKKFIFYPKRPDWRGGPVTLLFKKYVGNYFSEGKAAGA